jgi:serine-protein kinase ATM
MATRISLIRSVRQREQREQIGNLLAPFAEGLIEVEKQCLVRLSAAARESNQVQIALNSIVRAQGLEKDPTFEVSQEFASVLWLQREQKLAVQFLKDLVGHDGQPTRSELAADANRAALLARLVRVLCKGLKSSSDFSFKGTWTSEACLEKPTDILTHFFEPATSIVDRLVTQFTNTLESDHATVYHQCAMFAEHQYLAIVRSPDTIRWKIYIDRKTQEIKQRNDQIAKTQRGSKDFMQLTQVQTKAEAMLVQDQANLQQNSGARDAFLEQAIDMYSRCLSASDAFDDDGAIRLCSLWFANFQDMPLQDTVRTALDRVPSRKFVFLAHQLSARLSTSPSGHISRNQANLQALVFRMCREHPFHSLYQVYALRPERSADSTSTNSRRQSARNESSSQADRASAAGEIFDRLHGDSVSRERVRAVELVCDASLQWAKHPIKKDSRFDQKLSKGPFKIPDDLLIRKIQNIRVPIVTSQTPLDPTLRYDNCVCIARFENTFDTAGGVNLPKITICYGNDGKKYKQLVGVLPS